MSQVCLSLAWLSLLLNILTWSNLPCILAGLYMHDLKQTEMIGQRYNNLSVLTHISQQPDTLTAWERANVIFGKDTMLLCISVCFIKTSLFLTMHSGFRISLNRTWTCWAFPWKSLHKKKKLWRVCSVGWDFYPKTKDGMLEENQRSHSCRTSGTAGLIRLINITFRKPRPSPGTPD